MVCGLICTKCGEPAGHFVRDHRKPSLKKEKYKKFVKRDLVEIIGMCSSCGTGEKISIVSGKIVAEEPFLPMF